MTGCEVIARGDGLFDPHGPPHIYIVAGRAAFGPPELCRRTSASSSVASRRGPSAGNAAALLRCGVQSRHVTIAVVGG